MPIIFKGGKRLTRTQLAKRVGKKGKPNWRLANWIEHHGKGVKFSPERKKKKKKRKGKAKRK